MNDPIHQCICHRFVVKCVIPNTLSKKVPSVVVSFGSPFGIRRCESADFCRQGVVTIISHLTLIEKSDDKVMVALSSNVSVGKKGVYKDAINDSSSTISDGVPLVAEESFSVNRTLVLSLGRAQTVRLLPEVELVLDLK